MYFGFLREESVVTKSNIISSRLFFSFFDRKEKGERKVERERERERKRKRERTRREKRRRKKMIVHFYLTPCSRKNRRKLC